MKTNIYFDSSWEPLDIRYDSVFKAVFTRDTPKSIGALSDLISSFIGRKLTVATITANEQPIDDTRDRCIRYDISCKSESGELVNIEMSLNPDVHEPVRLEYYACKLFSRQDIRSIARNYSDLKESYQITLLANRRIFDDDALVHKFRYHDSDHNVSLGGRSQIITVELRKAELVIDKPVKAMEASEAWASFFQYLTDREKREKINMIVQNEGGIAMASEVLIEITQEDREWARQLSEEKFILDKQSRDVTAWREGHKEGLQEGRRENQLEVARNLKANGASIELITNSTGLTPEEIARF